jgi:hypothetical protein
MRWRLTEVQARSKISLRTFRKTSLILGRPGSPLRLTLLFGSERVFSKAGDLISKKRNRLAPGTADTIMCLRYWITGAWKHDFSGDSINVLRAIVDHEQEAFDATSDYAKFIPVVQSSGMGKSRLMDEYAKYTVGVIFTFRIGDPKFIAKAYNLAGYCLTWSCCIVRTPLQGCLGIREDGIVAMTFPTLTIARKMACNSALKTSLLVPRWHISKPWRLRTQYD